MADSRHGWEAAPGAIAVAVGQVRAAEAEWARLEPGDGLVRTWPAHRGLRAAAA